MKLARVAWRGGIHYGRIEGQRLVLCDGSFEEGFTGNGTVADIGEARILAPVQPSKIVALGRNYVAHARELGNAVPSVPKIFLKAPTAVVGPDDPIRIPPGTTRVDPEGELAVVIGRRLFCEPADTVMSAVYGYTVLNDVTARDFQKADGVFTRAKGFDSFCPIGPWIETELSPFDLRQTVHVNGELRSQGSTADMVFDIPAALAFISGIMTLLPGDVVSMGTPPGVAPVVAGDEIEIEIEGIGVLRNPVVNREDR